ncbi:MAG: RNA-guided endonuclease IscB [Cyanobacteriota bacterium]|nr:RNA-guided endonuclease IscB [Cyanobacteriota bacterium]
MFYSFFRTVKKLCRLAPITAISTELVRFDTQKMVNPEISGVEYQQGELAGYEVREYLLEKFNHTCVYCGAREVPFNLDHFHPKSKGGSNRVSNLVLSCVPCNQNKDNQLPADFLSDKPKLLALIEKQRKQPLADTAAANATRWKLKEVLESTGLPVKVGSGGLTKFNRKRLGISKSHWSDAACVGHSTPDSLNIQGIQPLLIKATGHGSRQMVNSDKYGFPRGKPKLRQKVHFGFQTGDIVKADIPKGKYIGTHTGRIAVRKTGNFKLKTSTQTFDVNHKYCRYVHKSDGFSYGFGELVKQKVKIIKQTNQPINPTQLNLFDTTEFSVVGGDGHSSLHKTKSKRTRKFKGTDGEQLSLF